MSGGPAGPPGPLPDDADQGEEPAEAVEGSGVELTKEEFFGVFRTEQAGIRQALAAVQGGDKVNDDLDELLTRVQALEVSFTRIAHILPAYDVQQYRAQSKDMAAEIAVRREQLAPRKKFSFKKKTPDPGRAPAERPCGGPARADAAGGAQPPSGAGGAGGDGGAASGEVFEGLRNQTVSRSAGDLSGQDVTLRDLEGCRVVLLGGIGALHCFNMSGCEIVVGAVGSSSILHSCENCVFTMATKQLRVHDSKALLFHVHTLSGPVVERCQRIAFAPFDVAYDGSEAHLHEAALGTPAGAGGPWADVQDFNWHRRQASPNWCVLPEGQRRERQALASTQAVAMAGSLPPPLAELERCQGAWEAAEAAAVRPAGAAGAAAPAAAAPPAAAAGAGGAAAAPAAAAAAPAAAGAPAAAAAAAAAGPARLDSDDEF